ncbi:MAG TPA: type IV toxin-antitoxin system AbiEi family antitoxin domain-containing protein [Solirubrobacteraceae bacterium]|nr:type IV toxin-antitoxin system AbiEi family antitoxin domain-containing protein [Solirubrobacteraceae bacterium]
MARPLQRLFDVAEGQWGLCTRQQAQQAGVGASSLARLADNGLLERVAHGVYRIRGAAEPDHLELRAAWLQLEPGVPAWARVRAPGVALVSHASAASMYGVGDLRADVHEFTLPVRRQTRRTDVRLHRGHVPDGQWILMEGLPVTIAGQMIADLLDDHVEPASVAQITVEVVHRVFDYPGTIAERIAPYAARFGFRRGDGVALLDHLLMLADYSDRKEMVALARGDER